ncbi:replication-relaxation family protein [Alkalihalobacillus sp. FSL R5-0424]
MNERDKAILSDLKRFRVMRRDDICKIHFSNLKQPVKACNNVLKRLRRDGYVHAITDRNQYFYHHAEQQLKKDSAKIPHFLAILDVYLKLCEVEVPRVFDVEPKLSDKGTVEPDVFCIWRKAPFYIEVQRTNYSAKVFKTKMDRYETFFYGEEWHNEKWQPKNNKPVFPRVWVIGEGRYDVTGRPFHLMSTKEAKLN